MVGTTISGRNLPIDGIETSVGLYINTLPLILEHGNDADILTQIQQVQERIHEMNSHSAVSLAKLQSSGRRLFDSLLIYENYPTPQVRPDSPIKLGEWKGYEELDYPLAIVAYEQAEVIQVTIKYAGELFSEDTIQTLLNNISGLLTQITVMSVREPTGLELPGCLQ